MKRKMKWEAIQNAVKQLDGIQSTLAALIGAGRLNRTSSTVLEVSASQEIEGAKDLVIRVDDFSLFRDVRPMQLCFPKGKRRKITNSFGGEKVVVEIIPNLHLEQVRDIRVSLYREGLRSISIAVKQLRD